MEIVPFSTIGDVVKCKHMKMVNMLEHSNICYLLALLFCTCVCNFVHYENFILLWIAFSCYCVQIYKLCLFPFCADYVRNLFSG